ncbi:MAG: hypothetical protein H6P99_41 [Holophagaceae bacterium]|nr:hypothetical protein [Holophagaceae bacterium]
MRLLMPWFLPLAAFMGWLGTRMAREVGRHDSKRTGEAALALAVMWFPLMAWILAQFFGD